VESVKKNVALLDKPAVAAAWRNLQIQQTEEAGADLVRVLGASA